MTPEQLIKHGNLAEAVMRLTDRIRSSPDNIDDQILLFNLFAMQSMWEKADRRLDVISKLSPDRIMIANIWRQMIAFERQRLDVFGAKCTPSVVGDPTNWIAELAAALPLFSSNPAAARELRDAAFEKAQPVSGSLTIDTVGDANDDSLETVDFTWIADADGRLGPIIEAFLCRGYYWVPIERIRSVTIAPSTQLQDWIWLRSEFHFANGDETIGYIPVTYVASDSPVSDAAMLGRDTMWQEASGVAFGVGQRMIATNADDYGLMSIRQIVCHRPEQEP